MRVSLYPVMNPYCFHAMPELYNLSLGFLPLGN